MASLSPTSARFMNDPGFEDVYWTVQGHLLPCATPRNRSGPASIGHPKAVKLETEAQVARAAQAIYLQSGVAHAMPPGSTVLMDDYARQEIRDWFERVAGS